MSQINFEDYLESTGKKSCKSTLVYLLSKVDEIDKNEDLVKQLNSIKYKVSKGNIAVNITKEKLGTMYNFVSNEISGEIEDQIDLWLDSGLYDDIDPRFIEYNDILSLVTRLRNIRITEKEIKDTLNINQRNKGSWLDFQNTLVKVIMGNKKDITIEKLKKIWKRFYFNDLLKVKFNLHERI